MLLSAKRKAYLYNANGRECIAILRRSIGVRGRLDSPELEPHFRNTKLAQMPYFG